MFDFSSPDRIVNEIVKFIVIYRYNLANRDRAKTRGAARPREQANIARREGGPAKATCTSRGGVRPEFVVPGGGPSVVGAVLVHLGGGSRSCELALNTLETPSKPLILLENTPKTPQKISMLHENTPETPSICL